MKTPRCKICSSPTTTLRAFSNIYYKCSNCNYIFKSILHKPGIKEERERYLSHENTPENTGYVKMFKNFLESAVFPFSPSFGRALDFGCGHGPVLAGILTETGYKTDLYDKYFFPQRPWTDKVTRYDIITSTEVFEHINHPLIILKILKKLLKPQGIVALMTQFTPDKESDFKNWWYLRDSTHISFYSPPTFKELAEKTGLKILNIGQNTCTLAASN